jgi:hypothetical protein
MKPQQHQLQAFPQSDATSLTHVASHATVQQYESCAQSCVAQLSQALASGAPVAQTGCEHVLGPASPEGSLTVQLLPQIEATSPTHVASQLVEQQYGSCAHSCVAHGSHVACNPPPVAQIAWAQVPPSVSPASPARPGASMRCSVLAWSSLDDAEHASMPVSAIPDNSAIRMVIGIVKSLFVAIIGIERMLRLRPESARPS